MLLVFVCLVCRCSGMSMLVQVGTGVLQLLVCAMSLGMRLVLFLCWCCIVNLSLQCVLLGI